MNTRKDKNLVISSIFYNFFKLESSSGVLLIFITILTLIIANSPLHKYYHQFIHLNIGFEIEGFKFEQSLTHWVNDALMSIFFLVVGLEIKREILIGELATLKKALLPIFAALGGMLFPALIFYFINMDNPDSIHGWGIPMATDIAFALGILSITGKKFPISLKVFLTAFATIDDIGGIIVIAIFYSSKIYYPFLLGVLISFIIMLLFNRAKILNPIPYAILGIIMWFFMFKSGIHSTLAGLLSAIAIPAKGIIDIEKFKISIQGLLNKINLNQEKNEKQLLSAKKNTTEIQAIEELTHHFIPPLLKIEHLLHPWIAFSILPFFAFINSGIYIEGNLSNMIFSKTTLGIMLGLIIGKQLGIFLFTFLAVKLKISVLPNGVNWKMIYAVSILGGIGFTMSLFITNLAYSNQEIIKLSKIGILSASLLSSILGILVLNLSKQKN